MPSQPEIDALITCPKIITNPPHKEMKLVRGSFRNSMELRSRDGDAVFEVFMRKNEDYPENFSIGLVVKLDDAPGSMVLIRYNGPHGAFLADDGETPLHFAHHVHKAKESNIITGLSPEKGGETTEEFNSYRDALRAFIARINVLDAEEYFDLEPQLNLYGD